MAAFDRTAHVNNFWTNKIKPSSPIYAFLLSEIAITAVDENSVVAELKLGPSHINSKGTLHGAVSATLVDWASSMAIAATGRDRTGVSTDLHTTYISTAKIGDVLVIRGTASKVGSNLAYTTVDISKSSGEVVAHGVHTKFIRQ